jgi:hypothetical protein
MQRLVIALCALVLAGCAGLDHPWDDPARDECQRAPGEHVSCPGHGR